ncbi:MAG TPA: hypothetical protein VHB79_08240 [Polyangiaceae bacterium]|nr:hypothetical protein [Polyangiaceae bacterium]
MSSEAGAQTPPKPGQPAAPKAAVAKPAAAASGKPTGAKAADAAAAKPAEVQLSDEAELARVAGLYEAGKYPECSSEIERLLDPTGRAPLKKPSIIENARVYWSACLLGAGDTGAADAPLRAAIHENPQMKPPDSLVFPAPVIERFLKVRDSLVNEIRAAEQARIRQAQAEAQRRQRLLEQDHTRMRALEQLAREEVVVTKNNRAWAFVPFGVGQFQNREPRLGYTLLVGEALLGGLSYAAIVVQNRLATQAYEARRAGQTVDEVTQEENIAAWRTVKVGAFWAFAALAVGGVVQAQLDFVPEFHEKRRRALPPALGPASPSPAPKPISLLAAPYVEHGGGGFAVMGRF